MSAVNGRYETALSPVSAGGTISYWFTYNKGTPAYNSATYSYTVSGDTGGGSGGDNGSGGSWNGQTTFHIVNHTNGQWADNQVYWAIIGKDWNTGKFVYVDQSGNLHPMSTADNGALVKDGVGYTNYFHTIAQAGAVTIPPINSARILFSVGSPMYIRVVKDANGNIGYAGANIDNPSDPNIDVYFDFGEMAILPPSNANPGIFVNTTRVDQFGFPLKLRVQGLNGYDQTVGEPLTESRSQLMSEFQSQLPSQFASLVHSPYRIVAPAHGSFGSGQANVNYMQSYIDSVWSYFRTHDLVFTLDNMGTFHGHVEGNTFVFTGGNANGTYYINGEPSTQEVFLGNGLLNDPAGASDVGVQLQIQAQLCAALNRHVAENPSLWYDQSAHYPAGQAANWYAKFWHDHSIDAKAYGFAYDDVGGFSPSLHTNAPTDVTFTIGW
ncbi:hypothetical protein HBF24_02335 [Oleiagrimonas sp. C23AA]|nr:hypothetical protein [Oleiagrimonas sp. C23AA]